MEGTARTGRTRALVSGAALALALGALLAFAFAGQRRPAALALGAGLALAWLGAAVVRLRRRQELLGERHARAEDALRRRERLAAMGELASALALEARQPLEAIATSTRRLRREFLDALAVIEGDACAEADELLGVVESAAQRIERTLRQFQDLARPRPLDPRPTDLGALVAGVAEAVRAGAEARGATLAADVNAAGEAEVDPDLLRQALDNLARNAVEATPPGGRVTLAARRAGGLHVIEVTDTGPGIAPGHLPYIFDPYFTTKPEAAGVGLFVTRRIVGAHGGTLEVDSRPGEGTRMTVLLPTCADPGPPPASAEQEAQRSRP